MAASIWHDTIMILTTLQHWLFKTSNQSQILIPLLKKVNRDFSARQKFDQKIRFRSSDSVGSQWVLVKGQVNLVAWMAT